MNKKKIPKKLYHLIPLVEKWGIGDDGYRDELVYESSYKDIEILINSLVDEDFEVLNKWFCDPKLVSEPNEEYLKFSAFFMAYEFAKSRFRDGKYKP
jgi:hypothetical protein